MSFDWAEYLKLAKDLAGVTNKTANKQAILRTSISRAYYSAHHKAKIYLKKIITGLKIPHRDAHEFVINKFEELGTAANDEFYTTISTRLSALRSQRIQADYWENMAGLNLESQIKLILRSSESIVSVLKTS